jgi:hypothetical protein
VNSVTTFEKSPERAKRSESTPDPGSPGQVRRTRGATPAKRSATPKMKSNGHDTGVARVNGHGPASPSQATQEHAPHEQGRAASDDARDFPTAAAASSAAAGKERDACAEVAQAPEGEKNSRSNGRNRRAGTGTPRDPSEKNKAKDKTKNEPKGKSKKGTVDIPPGSEPLPENGPGFVDAMHEHVDIYQACARLVKSDDQKIAQRMVERLLEMKYGKAASASAEEAPEIVIDIDSAVARRAAEGANK